MFKIAHLSDLHLGYHSTRRINSNGVNIREMDGYTAFSKVVNEIIKEDVNAVIIAGDTFHSPNPTPRSVLLAQTQLRKLSKAKIPVYILAGNHDVSDVKSDIGVSKLLHDPARRIYSHVEPYVTHNITDDITVHMVSHHLFSEQEQTMSQIATEKDKINIFATHGSLIDPILKIKLHTEQSPREIIIPDNLLYDNDWDMVMLGHIHERSYISASDDKDQEAHKIYYNGSLIRRGFSDGLSSLGRGWTLWIIDDNGKFVPDYKNIAQRPQYDFDIIDGSEDLTTQDISDIIVSRLIKTQLNGETFDDKTAPIIRQRFKNISSNVYSALDWNAINRNAAHTLDWKPIIISQKTENDDKITFDGTEQLQDVGDIVKVYDSWIEESDNFRKIHEDHRESVQEQTRKFIELGQEKVLNDE